MRISEDHSRHGVIVGLARLTEYVGCDDPRLILPDVRQLPDAVDVANRPEPFGGAQTRVDVDAATACFDADSLEAEPVDAWTPTRGDEQPIAAQLPAVVEFQNIVLAIATRCIRVYAEREFYSVATQYLTERIT